MKPWNGSAKQVCFSTLVLTLCLVSASSHAELIEIQDPNAAAPGGAEVESAPAVQAPVAQPQQIVQPQAAQPQALLNNNVRALPAQPVTISAGMAPQVIPQAVPQTQLAPQTYSTASRSVQVPSVQDPNSGLSVAGASTGVGGSNPGNANTGGVQVQSVNVQTTQEVAPALSDLMRRERMRKELYNEQALVEQLEKGRLEDENQRTDAVKAFSPRVANTQGGGVNDLGAVGGMGAQVAPAPVTVVPVAPVAAAPVNEEAVPVATVSAASINERGSNFKIAPFAGYRWFESNNAEYEARNMGVVGVGLEGDLASGVAIGATMTYGRDEFDYQAFGYASNGYSPYNMSYNNGYYNGGYYANSVPYELLAPRSRDSFEVDSYMKLGVRMQKARPYVMGGIGGLLQRYDIDDSYTTATLEQIGLQRSTLHMTGSFGGGIDLEMSRNIGLGARFEYQQVLNKRYTEMQRIFGDELNRFRLTGNLNLVF